MCTHDKTKMNILQELKPNGKAIDWRGKKNSALYLSDSYRRLSAQTAELGEDIFALYAKNVASCANTLVHEPTKDGYLKYVSGMYCKNPLCPVCVMRRARKLFGQVNKIMEYIQGEGTKYSYILLTLTERNVRGENLKDALREMSKAWNKFAGYVAFKKMSHGYIKMLEISYNWRRVDFHPHFHVLIAVDEDYCADHENYVHHSVFMQNWRRARGLNYDPWVYVNKVIPTAEQKRKDNAHSNNDISYKGAVAEICKYMTKDTNYMAPYTRKGRIKFEEKTCDYTYDPETKKRERIPNTGIMIESRKQAEQMTDDVVRWLAPAIAGCRKVSFGGLFAEVRKKLKLTDHEDIDKEDEDEKQEERTEEGAIRVVSKWHLLYTNYVYSGESYIIEDGEKRPLPFQEYLEIMIKRRARASAKSGELGLT